MNEKDLPGGRVMRHLVRSRSELQRQVTELVEQRAAISEVLRAVANSPHDLQPIFDTILINATRFCRAKFGGLLLFEEKGFRTFARRGPPNPVYAERWPLGLVHPVGPGDPLAQLIESGSPVHIADLAADQAYLRRNPRVVALVELAEVRTYLLVPLRKDDELATSRNEPDGVSVEVRDSGPGFAPADLDRVFEAFYTTKPEGMGLSICRSIIEAHGGRLRAIPCEPQGALFQSTIPAT
jgi:signal transduction histidine kinase